MENFIDELRKQERELEEILNKSEEDLRNAPKGTLRINCRGKRRQYYWQRDKGKEENCVGQTETIKERKYIKQQDMGIARALAQKGYAERIRKCAEHNLETIRKFLSQYDANAIKEAYEKIHEDRKKLIEPYILSDEELIKKWENERYEPKDFGRETNEIYTEKGERVRSKSEKILADRFYMLHIPYHYEKPLYLKGFGTVYPDFTILNMRTRKVFYYEHFGMMDNTEYCEKAFLKISHYEKNGIFLGEQLLISYETRKNPLNIQNINQKIQKYLL